MGAEHGGWCVGCCWGRMLALFALGVMSIAWMVMIAAGIFVEKVLPRRERLTWALGGLLLALAVLVQPGSTGGMSDMNI